MQSRVVPAPGPESTVRSLDPTSCWPRDLSVDATESSGSNHNQRRRCHELRRLADLKRCDRASHSCVTAWRWRSWDWNAAGVELAEVINAAGARSRRALRSPQRGEAGRARQEVRDRLHRYLLPGRRRRRRHTSGRGDFLQWLPAPDARLFY